MTNSNCLADVIIRARERKGYSLRQLGDIAGINYSAVSRIEHGGTKSPSPRLLKPLAEALDLSFEELLVLAGYLDAKDDVKNEVLGSEPSITKSIKIPILGEVVAGVPLEAVEIFEDYIEISESMARNGDYFALRVKGDSMEPRMVAGDILVVKKQSDVNSGDVAIVLVAGENATVKKFFKHDGGISLQSYNPNYDPMFFTKRQVSEMPVEVIGKVVQIRVNML